MTAWHWILLTYPWTVVAALLFLQAPSERRVAAINALLWPVLIPWAFLSGPLSCLFSTLRWWPQQRRLITMTEGLLSAYPDRRLRQVESRLQHSGKLGAFMLRHYYAWLRDEQQRLTTEANPPLEGEARA